MSQLEGMVLRIEKSSINDGEGLRTVVFLKGCPLTCLWCSTPESQFGGIETGADKTFGRLMSVDQVVAEVEKDKIFYFHSGGGMTLSGGEPLAQPAFSAALLKECKLQGINTAMESCLFAPYEDLEKVVPYLDQIYIDLKFVDSQKHKQFCGTPNQVILENIRRMIRENPQLTVIVRIPMIPGINDSDEDMTAAATFCCELNDSTPAEFSRELKPIAAVEFLPYHRLGIQTYEQLGRPYGLADLETPSPEYCLERIRIFESHTDGITTIYRR